MKTKAPRFEEVAETASDIVRRAADLKSAAPELITYLCGRFDCQWGTYWHVDGIKHVLVPAFFWSNESVHAEKLRQDTASRSLTLSEGTAGHVWRTGVPVCTDRIVRDMCLPRSLDASGVGLRGGIWFPIHTSTEIFGVVELLGRHGWLCDQGFLDKLRGLGLALGEACRRVNHEVAHLD